MNLKKGEPPRLVCTKCHTPHYLDPKLVSCTVVESDGGIVLLRRGIQPQKGKWVMPGGYVDRGETVEHAACRETLEECGLTIRLKELLGIYSYQGEAVVIVVFTADYLSGDLHAGDETADAGLFKPNAIPWEKLAFKSTKDALTDYLKIRI
jgi:ADP-ribose pyrophosphatase YjhB (NUDIX family)